MANQDLNSFIERQMQTIRQSGTTGQAGSNPPAESRKNDLNSFLTQRVQELRQGGTAGSTAAVPKAAAREDGNSSYISRINAARARREQETQGGGVTPGAQWTDPSAGILGNANAARSKREWEARRNELQKELDNWWNGLGWEIDGTQATAREQQRRQILAELDTLDRKIWDAERPEAEGKWNHSEPRVETQGFTDKGGPRGGLHKTTRIDAAQERYTPKNYEGLAGRGHDIISGASGDYFSGGTNFVGTALDALHEVASSSADTNPYAGWATDEMSAAQIGYEHDKDKLGDYEWMRNAAKSLESAADALGGDAAEDLERAKRGLSSFGQAATDIATNVIQMGYDAALGKLSGTGSLTPLFIRSAGAAAQEARQEGASTKQQLAYGLAKGSIEVLTEKLGDGVAKIYGKGMADELVEGAISRLAKSDTGRTLLRVLSGAAEEGLEEVISDLAEPYAKLIYNSGNAKDVFLRTFNGTYIGSELLYDFLIGATIGLLGGGVSLANGQNAEANDRLRTTEGFQQQLEARGYDRSSAQYYSKLMTKAIYSEEISAADRARMASMPTVLEVLRETAEGQTANALNTATDAELDQILVTANEMLRQPGIGAREAEALMAQRKDAEDELYRRANRLETNENAAPNNENGAVNNTLNGGTTNAQTEPETKGVLGQAQAVPATGEETGRAGAPDAAAASPAAGLEAAQPVRAEAAGGSGGRYADPGFRGESERVVRSAEERRERAAEQGRRASARQSLGTALWERGEVNLQSARELGITNGSETQDLKVFPQEHYDEEMQDVADWVASEYGLPVTFVSGIIHVADRSGNLYRVRGVYTGNGIILQADNRNESITSLARHEVFHDEAARDAGLVEAIRAELVAMYSPEEMRRILRGYIINLRGEINVDENTDMEELDEAAMRIFEEVCADAAGGINAFGLGAYQYENTVNRVRGERAALRDQADGERETRGPPRQRNSYGGELAWEGDFAALDVAEEMEREGADAETIRQDTGWFRGMDGKWRFEIDDSAMELRGDYRDFLDNQHTERGMKLSELIYHSSLFNQYPQLAGIDVAFDIPEASDTYGSWSGSWGGAQHISLNQKLLADGMEGELLDTLIHEMQHAIQDTEGFASGSNPKYWERQLKEGYDGRTRAEREASREAWERYNQIREEDPEFFEEAADLMLSTPDSPRGAIDWDTFEQLEPDPPEWQEFDARRDALEKKYGEEKMFNFMDLYHEVKSKETTRRSNYELYRKTAGEIEARDATNRRGMNTEQRKAKRPDIDQEDVVFARSRETGYALRDIKIPTREELEAKEDIPVVDIREETSGSFKEQRDAFLNSEEAQALYSEPALNRDTNEPLFIIPASITHTFSNAGQENILLAKHLREIAENAILTHGEPSRNAPDDHTTGVYKFFGAVQTADGVQPVKLTVKEYSVEGQPLPKAVLDLATSLETGDTYATLYDGKVLVLESIEKEASGSARATSETISDGDTHPAASNEGTSSSAASSTQGNPAPDNHPSVPTISVKDLLDLVKGEDAKYIPQRKVSDGTRYSADDSEIPGAIWGDEDETFVNDTEPVKFRWAIVPLESLVVSNDTSGSVNPAYPAELQPRNRGRQASQLQMEKISRNINPRQLEDSPNAQNGAPIIRSDGVVIGGNIRSMALTDAYNKGRADAYRDYVSSRAARKFGLDTSELPERPVLVRVAEDVSDWAKLARDLNTSTIAAYSATERAMADAARMDSRIMSLLNPDEDGNINTTANKDFIQGFIANVVPDNERGAAITGSGLLSQDGLERAEYAIFAAAYRDADLMQHMSESLDNDMKNVTNGLLDIAPRVMQAEAEADAGRIYDVGARDRILEAVQLYTEAKRTGKTVEEFTANHSLTDDWSDETIYVARYIEKNKRSAKQIRTFFNGMFDEIESYGDPNQLNFFGEEETHNYREALEGAIKRYEQATGTELPRLSEWGAGEFEAVEPRGKTGETDDAVSDGGDSISREDSGGRQLLDGGRGDGGGRGRGEALEETAPVNEAPEVPWDASPLPPPPTAEPEPARKPKRPERKNLSDYVETYATPQGGRQLHTPNIPEGMSVDEYARAAEARAEAAKQERLRNIPKDEFTGTKHLQKLGVKVENSVGIYRFIDSMIANHRAAKAFQRELGKAEKRLKPTAKEKEFAAAIAAGTYTSEDIPSTMKRATVEELADYYFAERAISNDLINKQRKSINQALDEKMESLFENSADDNFKPSSAVVLNNRTPERNMRKIFGDKLGEEINRTIFYPVQANEAERIRFINRMHEEVRKFKGSDGKVKELNEDERALVQMLIEGKAVQEEVASIEMRAAIESAGQNILRAMNGVEGELKRAEVSQAAAVDAAREFSLNASEAKLAQRYARWLEAQELLKRNRVDSLRVDNAVKKYGEMFGKFYDAINDFLVAHGYEPIGFIRGYAPHMQPEENQKLLNKAFQVMGINTDVTRLPSSIAGLTADYKPNKRWNPYFLQRVGNVTEYDIASAYESYVDYMSDVLYHTDDIMRIRAMSRYFRHTYAPDNIRDNLDAAFKMRYANQEEKTDFLRGRDILSRESTLAPADTDKMLNDYVDKLLEEAGKTTKYSDLVMWIDNYANTLAGKQSMIDRGWEVGWGRKVLNIGNKLTRAFATAQVAGNLSSMLNQSAQLPQIQAELGTKYVAAALKDNWNGKLRRSAWAQDSDFLTGKNGIDYLVTDWQDMIVNSLFKPADFMDGFMATLAVRGRYLKEIEAGKSHTEAMRAADQFGREVMGSRMRGARPTAYDAKNPLSQMLHIFQIEAVNSWEHLTQDVMGRDFRTIAEAKGKKAAAAAMAGVIVKMLLSAFLLNRLDEELYGGTPAPFDIFGLFANFVASGEGLTTNQWLKTVMDNGWEKLTGERLFDTDAEAMQGDFDLEEALKDAGYNISNDIPFLRNFAALMGWGDNSLPIPDVWGAGTNVVEAVKEHGFLSEQTGKAFLSGVAEWIPAGRQATKTIQGLQLMSQGGRYVNGRLYYPVENSLGNWLKALLFGPSALYETDAFYAGDDKKLSERQTGTYKELTENGADRFTVYQAVQDYKVIEGNDNLGSYERGRLEREAITNADLTDEQRLALYRGMSTNNEGRAEDFEEIMGTGLTWAETVQAYDKWAELNANEDMSKTEKAEAYAAWVERQDYGDEERASVRDHFKFWQSIPIESTKVDRFADAGMEIDAAEQLSETLRNLQPLPGKTSVTDLQRYQAIADSDLGVEDQWTAIVAQTNPSYTSTLDKIQIYRQQGITPSVWTASKSAMYAADDAGNNNDSTDQAEAKAALDGMNIPDWQKAILWQTTNKSWKANKNPYDRKIGQAICDQMNSDEEEGPTDGSLTPGTWGPNSINYADQSSSTPSSPGLELGTWGGGNSDDEMSEFIKARLAALRQG